MVELVLRPDRETSSVELARRLGTSRESVYQLLLPLVRAGHIRVGRGRNGGYRPATGAEDLPVADVVAPYGGVGTLGAESSHSPKDPPWIRDLSRRADEAYRRVLGGTTVGQLAAAVRASRQALDWEI